MKSKISPGNVAIILRELQSGVPISQQFPKLLTQFQPLIDSMAGSFSYGWKNDFIQEGRIGLFRAINSFSTSIVSPEKFISYASTSIRYTMTDFYRKVVRKSMDEQTEYSIDGGEQKYLQPVFGELAPVKFDEEKEEDAFNNVPSSFDSATAAMQDIDFKYNFSNEGLSKNGFFEKEIDAFNLYLIQGYHVSEVAEQIGVSAAQSSKIIAKVRKKALQILNISIPNNLN